MNESGGFGNGNPGNSSSSSSSANGINGGNATGNGTSTEEFNGTGARPKIRNARGVLPPEENSAESSAESSEDSEDEAEVEDLESESDFKSDLEADLPKSFYGGVGGVGGNGCGEDEQQLPAVGQSNLSSEVAALIINHNENIQNNNLVNNNNDNSPEMDFLEMDFDPDSDLDSGRGDDEPDETSEMIGQPAATEAAPAESDEEEENNPNCASPLPNTNTAAASATTTTSGASGLTDSPITPPNSEMPRSQSLNSPINRLKCTMVRGDSDPGGISAEVLSAEIGDREICGAKLSQRELFLFPATSTATPMVESCSEVATSEDSCSESKMDKTMIFVESEACKRLSVPYCGKSSYGTTAVINVLQALEFPSIDFEEIKAAVKVRTRDENALIPRYLKSRSVAGTWHQDLIQALQSYTKGSVVGKFFHMYPRRRVQLSLWIADWLKKGAVPIATLNLQRGVREGGTIPDGWHHQMIFGVGSKGIYLSNPTECVSESILREQLCSPSSLLIRRNDVIKRWTDRTDLRSLIGESNDEEWENLNVLGQVVNLLREEFSCNYSVTSHIRIPAIYKSGITLFLKSDSPHVRDLNNAPELPHLFDIQH